MPKIHPLSDVQSTNIGKNTVVWQFCIILPGAKIGEECNICAQVFVAGINIGKYSLVGAGSVVTKDIPSFTVWYGNPAQKKGYITKEGVLLDINKKDKNGKLHNI